MQIGDAPAGGFLHENHKRGPSFKTSGHLPQRNNFPQSIQTIQHTELHKHLNFSPKIQQVVAVGSELYWCHFPECLKIADYREAHFTY